MDFIASNPYPTLPLPLDVVNHVFEYLPTELPIVAQVCSLWEKMIFGFERSDPFALVARIWTNILSPFDPYKNLTLGEIQTYDREQKIDLLIKDLQARPLQEIIDFIQKNEWGLQLGDLSQKNRNEILIDFKTALSCVEEEMILQMITDRLDQKLLNLVSSKEFKFYARSDKYMVEQIAKIKILDIDNFFERIPIAASKLEKLNIIYLFDHRMQAKHYENIFCIKFDRLFKAALQSPKSSAELRRQLHNGRYNLLLSYRSVLCYPTQNTVVSLGQHYFASNPPIPEFIETQIWPTLAAMDPWELEPALKALCTYLDIQNLIKVVDFLIHEKKYDTLFQLCLNLQPYNYDPIFAHIQEKFISTEEIPFAHLFLIQYLFYSSNFVSKVSPEFENKTAATPYTDLSGLQSWIQTKSFELNFKFIYILKLVGARNYTKYIPILRAMFEAQGTSIPGFSTENKLLCYMVAELAAQHGDWATVNNVLSLSNVTIPTIAK